MQYKGVSCGPLSFIHAAAACELPAWQTCRRVLWHPVESCSHSSIRGSQSCRAGAHLHKKYMNTLLTYVTLTTNLFLLWLWKTLLQTVQHSQNHCGVIYHRSSGSFPSGRCSKHIYGLLVCIYVSYVVYLVHDVATVVPC